MIDLTKSNAADLMFLEITSQEPGPERSNLIRAFVKVFWSQLSDQCRKAYTQCYVNPETFDDVSDDVRIKGEMAYNRGMAKQDFEMLTY